MIAVGLAWFIVRRSDDTIYRSQLRTRADAPAQRLLIGMPVLADVPVSRAMAPPRLVITGGTSVAMAHHQLTRAGLIGAPVVDGQGRFEGTLTLQSLEANEVAIGRRLESLLDPSAPTVTESAHLDVALDAMTSSTQHWVPVLDTERKVVGTVATSDVVRGYRLGLLASLQKMNVDGDAAGSDRVLVGAGSPLAGQTLREADLPISIIVTTIQRDRDLVVPSGTTVLEAGDELVLIGRSSDIDAIRAIASGVDDLRGDAVYPDTEIIAQKEAATKGRRP
jgi:CBS domain-containing protein